MSTTGFDIHQPVDQIQEEQLPVAPHKKHGVGHFFGLYAAEHVAATEFVIGATFVGLGADIWDILIGLMIGNTLATLSFTLLTAPIAIKTGLSLYTYLERIGGASLPKFYNAANVLIFAVISAAMITVSATAVRALFNVPVQKEAYPTSLAFVAICAAVGVIVVLVAAFGFNAVAEFASICAPWLMVMFTVGGMVLIPALAESVTGFTTLTSFSDFVTIAGESVFTGVNSAGEPGIGMLEVIGFAWAANTFAHFGLIDMALLRYAKRPWYGLASSSGMMFGHYVAWISAGLMGAATAAMMNLSIDVVDPGDVAFFALGASGFVIVIVAGWTTANSNLYRAGLALQALMPNHSRARVTMIVGIGVVFASAFPVVFRNMLPLLTYAGLILVPVGGIALAEHMIFPRIGLSRYWARYKGLTNNTPAVVTWAVCLVFGFGLDLLNIISFYYLFLPTWALSIGLYIWLAKMAGAGEDFTEQKREEEKFNERVVEYQTELAKVEPHEHVKDRRPLSKAIVAVWLIIGLLVPAILGWRVMFNSPDLYTYFTNREQFYQITIWCTLIYFTFAYWGLQRSKAYNKAHAAKVEAENRDEPQPVG
ncbi:MAG: hypothetical protein WA962_15780 [Ornithinimicrobium sp.]